MQAQRIAGCTSACACIYAHSPLTTPSPAGSAQRKSEPTQLSLQAGLLVGVRQRCCPAPYPAHHCCFYACRAQCGAHCAVRGGCAKRRRDGGRCTRIPCKHTWEHHACLQSPLAALLSLKHHSGQTWHQSPRVGRGRGC